MDWVMPWFILAGFVLGFAVSTLWEWLYFRVQRSRWYEYRISELEDELMRLTKPDTHSTSPSQTVDRTNANPIPQDGTPSYRSPDIFLDTEQVPSDEAPSDRRPDDRSSEVDISPAALQPTAQDGTLARSVQATQEPRPYRHTKHTAVERNAPVYPSPAAPTRPPKPTTQPFMPEPRASSDLYMPGLSAHMPSPSTPSISPVPDEPAIDDSSTLVTEPDPPDDMPKLFTNGYSDDLTRIAGVGEVYRERLYEADLFTWHQVAMTSVEELRRITKARRNANVENWPQRAQELAEEHNRVGAIYSGPIPDDLTKINGIGPIYSQQLQEAGIHTYQQLAATSATALSKILIVPAVGEEISYDRWIQEAARLDAIKKIERGSRT